MVSNSSSYKNAQQTYIELNHPEKVLINIMSTPSIANAPSQVTASVRVPTLYTKKNL